MKRVLLVLVLMLITGTAFSATVEYFPKGVFTEFVIKWYTKHLDAMHEPSLWELRGDPERHVYRFLWLRTWGAPISVRLGIQESGMGDLAVKKTNGQGGYEAGELVTDTTTELTEEQVQGFLNQLEKSKFWELPTKDSTLGMDGAQWIIEGLKGGKYHIVDRWSPTEGEFHETALLMLRLGEIDTD